MLWFIFSVLYAAIATFSIYMTWCEHIVKKRKRMAWTLFGMLTCLAWPAVVVAVSLAQSRRTV